MQAMPQAPQLIPACSTFSSLLIVLTHNTKNRLHYTLNTLHQTQHNTLTIHFKHTICHKSLNSQNLPSLLRTLSWQKPVLNFFLRHQTQRNASPVLDVPSTQEVGRVGGLALSYTRTSTDSYSSLLSLCIRISSDRNRLGLDLFSLINPQQSV